MRIGQITGMALLALAMPAVAQTASPPIHAPQDGARGDRSEDAAAALKAMFKVEPLTAEQQARLPQAQALVAQIMPPGTLDQMMGGMFDKMLGPIMAMDTGPSSHEIAGQLGIEDEDFSLSDEDAARIAAILDPAYKERQAREMKAVQSSMRKVMALMEPSMRKGMAEAYAATFTAPEMTDIAAFFATPSGASFARKSYALASDPRIMSASMEVLPNLMGQMKEIEAEVKSATADLPAKKTYDALSAAERAALARLTGLTPAELRAGMARAAKAREELASAPDET